jgi:prepilin-type N-terminal cleavage/methylation domain-containing protein
MRSRIRKQGFTLIELLVVISIIAVLMSLLLPSLSSARESVKHAICRNNLRSIWTGVLQYAFNSKDRVPFAEDINLVDPDADPFAAEHKNSIGRMLKDYVEAGSWKCPGAIKGYPELAGPEGWTMTYWFRTAGKPTEGTPFSQTKYGKGGPLDPIVSNYVTFDGRPLKYVSGRRHTPSNPYAPNKDEIGPWTFSFPIISDLTTGSETQGTPKYPHRGTLDQRNDLLAARPIFEKAAGAGRKPARMELHAVSDKEVSIYLTRAPYPHKPGY